MAHREKASDLPCGTATGASPCGTVAYSNHGSAFEFRVNHTPEGFFTGVQWQCVEYARRWLYDAKGLVLQDHEIAAEIFFTPSVYDPVTKKHVAVKSYRNGGPQKPEADCFIIYAPAMDNFPGHIGVITHVGDDFIRIADQNREFGKWPGDYAMQLPLVRDVKGNWTIVDKKDPVLGWVTFPGVPNLPTPAPTLPHTYQDDKGATHACVRQPVPKDFAKAPPRPDKVRRHTFWRAMTEFRPHVVVMPFVLARVLLMMAYFVIKGKLRRMVPKM